MAFAIGDFRRTHPVICVDPCCCLNRLSANGRHGRSVPDSTSTGLARKRVIARAVPMTVCTRADVRAKNEMNVVIWEESAGREMLRRLRCSPHRLVAIVAEPLQPRFSGLHRSRVAAAHPVDYSQQKLAQSLFMPALANSNRINGVLFQDGRMSAAESGSRLSHCSEAI